MKRQDEVKDLIIENAIQLIADGGFEKATTKEITYSGGDLHGMKMNEVYIYRIFGNKEAVYDAAFARLDEEMFIAVKNALSSMGGWGGDLRESLWELFLKAWDFVLEKRDRCRTYIRYYHSVYFKGESLDSHNKKFELIASEFAPIFREEANVYAIMHSTFTALLEFAICVCNGTVENNDDTRHHVFIVLYSMMMTYFKEPARAF